MRLRSPSSAAPNSEHSELSAPTNLSEPHNDTLPLENVNNNKGTELHHMEPSQVRMSEASNEHVITSEVITSSSAPNSMQVHEPNDTGLSNPAINTSQGDDTVHDQKNEGNPVLSNKEIAETLIQVLAELKDIKGHMSKRDKMEASTTTLANQLAGVVERTAELETAVSSNATRLREVDDKLIPGQYKEMER